MLCSDYLDSKAASRYGFNFGKTPICCDNTSAIQMIQNLVQDTKSKHTNIRNHFNRDIVQKEKVELFNVPFTNQLADIFTKALDEKTLNKLIANLGMLSMT